MKISAHDLYKDSALSAKKAGLTYADITTPGFTRLKKGKNTFTYKDTKGKTITNSATISRIQSLAIPPAWKDVWISPSIKSHIQATGIDGKGAKQYKYHPKWSEFREHVKFDRLLHFANELPDLRKAITKDLQQKELVRTKTIAAVLQLMDKLAIRIGNEQYAEENKTYGLTTLKDHHAKIQKGHIILHFIGKSHKEHTFDLQDPTLAKTIKQSRDIPGSQLFQYIDEAHHTHALTSTEVNEYIKTTLKHDFTAKDFRMWAGTAHAYTLMKEECASATPQKTTKKALKNIITCVAEKLGNTPAVCKAHYVHGDLQKKFEDGSFVSDIKTIKQKKKSTWMSADELELAVLLKKLSK